MKKTQGLNVIVIALLMMSLFLNISMYFKVITFDNIVDNLKSDLNNSINSTNHNINSILNTIKKNSMWIYSKKYNIESVKSDFSEYKVKQTLELNERKNNEKLSINVVDLITGEQTNVKLPENDSLTYVFDLSLGNSNYKLNLVGTDDNTTRNEEINYIYLKDYKNSLIRTNGDIVRLTIRKNKLCDVDFYVNIQNLKLNDFNNFNIEIVSIKADFMLAKTVVGEVDFLNSTGYEKKELREITNSLPEYMSEVKVQRSTEKSLSVTYAGSLKFNEAISEKINENRRSFEDIYILVKLKDSNGNEYNSIVGTSNYGLNESGEIIKLY